MDEEECKEHEVGDRKEMNEKNDHTSAVQPLVAVCVHGFGPQLVQVTISFGPVPPPVGGPPSRFFLPCDRVSVEENLYSYSPQFV
ncbi:hypothetical protein M0804_005528 [Polistes exclamans]|nr:hypothetical protein M0804_005528 [Polistes exclamans]